MNRKSQKEIQVTTHMVRQFLQENEDTGYRDFHSNLLPGVDNVMGIRLPVLRKFAKQLSGMDWQEWFEQADDQWYEETMLRGLVSAYAKMECKERLTYVAKFVPDINNWAVCDCFCSTLKDADKYQTEYWDFIETYFTSNKEYEARFAAVMLLGHFVKREYLKESIRRLESITQQGYYAKMAVAWAVSVYFAAFPDEMLTYLQDGHKLDEFTYKKSLQKITESYRVDKEGNICFSIAKASFDAEKIADNLKVVCDTILKIRPQSVKGVYIKNCALHTVMGPSIKFTFEGR